MPESPPLEPDEPTVSTSSLRGTFIAVMIMAVLFAGSWFGMFALAMSRR